LELPPFEGRPFTREVEAATCADVVLALSLVVALAYDPDATTTFPATITAPKASLPPTVAPPSSSPAVSAQEAASAPAPAPEVATPELPLPPAPFGAAAGVA